MVSSANVNGDLSSLKTYLTNYNSEISDLSGTWQGPSHDNLVSKAEEFYSEYNSVIESEMTAFASACSKYDEYVKAKAAHSRALGLFEQAKTNNDSSGMNTYSIEASGHFKLMERLKPEIEDLLSQARATVLESSSGATSSLNGASFTAGKSLGLEAGTYEYTFTSSDGKEMKYFLYIPNNATEGMPLILYLHGDGSVNKMKTLKDGEMASRVHALYGDDFPFIFIQPMTEVTSWEEGGRQNTLTELVQSVASEYHCDLNKIALTGASRGGNGAWNLANSQSDLFSCFVPVSGRASIDANNFTSLPTLAFSTPTESDSWNNKDQEKLVKKINEAGGDATYVSLNGYNHSSAIKGAYTEDTFNWILSQTRGS